MRTTAATVTLVLPSAAGPLTQRAAGAPAGGRRLGVTASCAVAPQPARTAASGSANTRQALTPTSLAADDSCTRNVTTCSPICASYLPRTELRSNQDDESGHSEPQATSPTHRCADVRAAPAPGRPVRGRAHDLLRVQARARRAAGEARRGLERRDNGGQHFARTSVDPQIRPRVVRRRA